MTTYNHPRIPEVLEAYSLLLNETMALDYCGIEGKDRILILNDPAFSRESRKLKAGKYIEEIKDINELVDSLKIKKSTDNSRIGDEEEDPTKVVNLKMKVASMRREMLSLSTNEKESDEVDSLNIFFVDVTREEFERLMNVEVHEGDENSKLVSEDKESPIETAEKRKKKDKTISSIPHELARNVVEYTDENGEKIIEEVNA